MIFYLSTAASGLEKYMLPCMNKKLFGVPCPGCGLQRSIALLLKGEFAEAFFMYPGIYPLLALVVFVSASFLTTVKFEKTIKIILALLTGFTILISYLIKMIYIIN